MSTDNRKSLILDALRTFLRQRPDLASLGYGSVAAWRSESRKVTQDKNDALELIRAVELSSISADAILAEAGRGGRLTIKETFPLYTSETCPGKPCSVDCDHAAAVPDTVRIDYCAGQSYGHEFRAAVARLMASCLWSYVREECMPKPSGYRVESWRKWDAEGRHFEHAKHTIVSNREAAELQLKDLGGSDYGNVVELYLTPGRGATGACGGGDWLRAHFRNQFGKRMQLRWFDFWRAL